MSAISFSSIVKSYRGRKVLDRLDLDVAPRTFTVLTGPPKAGKSVLFRMLVGLEEPDGGRILLGGRDITNAAPAARAVGYVPQNFALYPHRTVWQNIAYPLTLARTPSVEVTRKVDRAAGILSITKLLQKTPDQLSGGEKQRVAVARGLVKDADAFVLDDPLVGLDYKLRERLMDELKALREELKATFLYATSDSLEALTMAQHLAVLDGGRLVQHDEATRVYHDPRDVRSLALVGFPHANLLPATVSGNRIAAGTLALEANRAGLPAAVTLGIRPEALRLASDATASLRGTVQLVENLGGDVVVYVEVPGAVLTVCSPHTGPHLPEIGEPVALSVDAPALFLFDAADGRRLDASLILAGGSRP